MTARRRRAYPVLDEAMAAIYAVTIDYDPETDSTELIAALTHLQEAIDYAMSTLR